MSGDIREWWGLRKNGELALSTWGPPLLRLVVVMWECRPSVIRVSGWESEAQTPYMVDKVS